MASPMIDLYGEHWPIDVDENGNGPITDPAAPSQTVCSECDKPWPCPSSELIDSLREGLTDLRTRITRAHAYLSREPWSDDNARLALMALDGQGPQALIAADATLSLRVMPGALTRLLDTIEQRS